MPAILSVGTASLPYKVTQEEVRQYVEQLFERSFPERLWTVFANGGIESRFFVQPLEWYRQPRTFAEKNEMYIKSAVRYGCEAVQNCLQNDSFLERPVAYEEIEAIFYVSTTGLSTPSVDAKIMNHLPFPLTTKRIPIWGLGCAGGAAGLARAYEYCIAFPKAKVLVIAAEFCSLTFQLSDRSKSNLIGTSLFADGVSCVCVAGDEAVDKRIRPRIVATQSIFMPHSETVMGWDIRDEGFFVIFSKDIPTLVRSWLQPIVDAFLQENGVTIVDVAHFVAHPGGKKVIEAYEQALQLDRRKTETSSHILRHFGNMSSATVYFVLADCMKQSVAGDIGLMVALGPGFSAELILLRWE